MEDKEAIKDLKRYLIRSFRDIDDFKGLANDADLDTSEIIFIGSAAQVCENVLMRAKLERRLPYLADAALRHARNDFELIGIRERLRGEETDTAQLLQAPTTPLDVTNGTANTAPANNLSTQNNTKQPKVVPTNKLASFKSRLSILTSRITLSIVVFTSISILYVFICLMITLHEIKRFITINDHLLSIDLPSSITTGMIIVGLLIVFVLIFLTSVFLPFRNRASSKLLVLLQRAYSKWDMLNRRLLLVVSLLMILIMLLDLGVSINFLHEVQSIVVSTNNSPYIGLCDGRCALDADRLEDSPKGLAAKELKNQHRQAACAYLEMAIDEDQTDAEAKIYYENQCSRKDSNNVPAPLSCPCINYIAAIALAQEKQKTKPDDPYADSTIYNNGISRSILQAVYSQQKAWNKDHPSGPSMYIFVANVGDVNDAQNAPTWQQNVAQQIIDVQQTDRDHRINGIVGLPPGMDTFIDQLDKNAIPMVTLAPMSSDDISRYHYLLSVVPTPEMEMTAAAHFFTKDIVANTTNNKQTVRIRIGVFYYDDKNPIQSRLSAFEQDQPLQDIVSAFRHNLSPGYTTNEQPYYSNTDVKHLATSAANTYDAIFFIGPINNLLTFLVTLRQLDVTTPVLANNTFYQHVYRYQPHKVQPALYKLYFTAFAYHDIEDYTNSSKTSIIRRLIISKFSDEYDPQGIHTGNIYTHRLPTSDAIVAFDAMGIFIYLVNHYGMQNLPSWQDQQAFLAKTPPLMASGNVKFTATGSIPETKTVLLLQMNPGVSYLDKD